MTLSSLDLPGTLMRLNSRGIEYYTTSQKHVVVMLLAYEASSAGFRSGWRILLPDGMIGMIPVDLFTLWSPVLV